MDDQLGHGRKHGIARAAMWSGIAVAGLLFVGFLSLGWSRGDALSAAAGALVLVCIGVCVWAWITTDRDWRRVPPYGRPLGAEDASRRKLGRERGGANV